MKTKPVDVPAFKDLGNPAFAVDTPPCVAQRVCPMPMSPLNGVFDNTE